MATLTTATPKLYIGMDINKKNWAVHIRTDISDHKPMTIPPKPEVLYDYVSKNFSEHEVNLVYEAGCCGFSASRYFLNVGWNVKVVNPSDIPTMNKQYYQKNDKFDCRNLSKQLEADQLRGIHIPDENEDQLKSLARQRISITRQLRASKTGIKALLLYQGIELPEQYDKATWTKEFINWLENIEWTNATGKACMQSKLRIFKCIYQEHLTVANELRSYCRKYLKKDYYLLKSIPGIGGYLAAVILAELGDIRRFNKATEFASYVGLIPMMRSSGGTENIFGITPRSRGHLRSYLIESAWVALRIDPEMQSYYRKHVGKNPKSIIVKIARKITNRILSVIKTEQPYVINRNMNN